MGVMRSDPKILQQENEKETGFCSNCALDPLHQEVTWTLTGSWKRVVGSEIVVTLSVNASEMLTCFELIYFEIGSDLESGFDCR